MIFKSDVREILTGVLNSFGVDDVTDITDAFLDKLQDGVQGFVDDESLDLEPEDSEDL